MKRIKLKGKKMFNFLNKAGRSYKEALFWYTKRLVQDEVLLYSFSTTWLLGIWKKKGSALDLNMMRYVHIKEWEAKLCEALVTEHMQLAITKACP